MKNLRYFIFMLISLVAVSCVEEDMTPRSGGDDDPIGQGGTGGGSGSGGGGTGGSGGSGGGGNP